MSTHRQTWDRSRASAVRPLTNRLRHGIVDRTGGNLTSIIWVPKLNMSGALLLLPLYAFMAWTRQHYVFLQKRVAAWHWQLWWKVIVLGYCYIVTLCIFEGYIERIWNIFFCYAHRTTVVMFVFTKKLWCKQRWNEICLVVSICTHTWIPPTD